MTTTQAFWAGRNAAHYGDRDCSLTGELLIEWRRGYRQVVAEDALDADTEWDGD